ncbi:hypothetical protein OIV83_001924 [Microbotryomycetes sp. JL201]|nr:hypothetical protein OIV83_001924 [Microbotryomycetes sp. JL201]
MAPAQLELFKFALYVFVPIAAMIHYGDPDWYERHVGPLREWYRRDDLRQVAPPQTTDELKAELDRLRDQRLARKQNKLATSGIGLDDEARGPAASQPSPVLDALRGNQSSEAWKQEKRWV